MTNHANSWTIASIVIRKNRITLKSFLYWLFLLSGQLWGQSYQLAPPKIAVSSAYFEKECIVQMAFDLDGAAIHYTLDGTAPTIASNIYSLPLHLKTNAVIQAIAVHPDFRSSESVKVQVQKAKSLRHLKSAKIIVDKLSKYPGNGPTTFLDLQKGTADFHDGSWFGTDDSSMTLQLDFFRKKRFSKLTINALTDTGSWIFPPQSAQIWASNDGEHYQLLVQDAFSATLADGRPANGTWHYSIPLGQRKKWQHYRIVVRGYGALPDWHAGKGGVAWLFLDEILFE